MAFVNPSLQKLTIIIEGGVRDLKTIYPMVEDLSFDVSHSAMSLLGNGLPGYIASPTVDKIQFSFKPIPDADGAVAYQHIKKSLSWDSIDSFPMGPNYRALLNGILDAHEKGDSFSISNEMAEAIFKAKNSLERR